MLRIAIYSLINSPPLSQNFSGQVSPYRNNGGSDGKMILRNNLHLPRISIAVTQRRFNPFYCKLSKNFSCFGHMPYIEILIKVTEHEIIIRRTVLFLWILISIKYKRNNGFCKGIFSFKKVGDFYFK